jgi:F0F1-type ATP synthase assembly protein I
MEDQPNQKEPKKPSSDGLKNFAHYSGLGIQMVVIILIAVWGGTKLDQYLHYKTPVFTVIFSLLGVFAGIYSAIRDFIR